MNGNLNFNTIFYNYDNDMFDDYFESEKEKKNFISSITKAYESCIDIEDFVIFAHERK